MKIKLAHILALVLLIVLWGLATSFHHKIPSTPFEMSAANKNIHQANSLTTPPLIPVTGNTQPVLILIIYSLIGLIALALIMALLHAANQSTTLSFRFKRRLPSNKLNRQ